LHSKNIADPAQMRPSKSRASNCLHAKTETRYQPGSEPELAAAGSESRRRPQRQCYGTHTNKLQPVITVLLSETRNLSAYSLLPLDMAPVQVTIKHAGKSFPVDLDTALSAVVFKDAIYKLTGVPGDRMKVMIKGGVLKVSFFPLSKFNALQFVCSYE
jgi:hypothetical protein